MSDAMIQFSWPVAGELAKCGLCLCVVQRSDIPAHAAWHGTVTAIGPVINLPASPDKPTEN